MQLVEQPVDPGVVDPGWPRSSRRTARPGVRRGGRAARPVRVRRDRELRVDADLQRVGQRLQHLLAQAGVRRPGSPAAAGSPRRSRRDRRAARSTVPVTVRSRRPDVIGRSVTWAGRVRAPPRSGRPRWCCPARRSRRPAAPRSSAPARRPAASAAGAGDRGRRSARRSGRSRPGRGTRRSTAPRARRRRACPPMHGQVGHHQVDRVGRLNGRSGWRARRGPAGRTARTFSAGVLAITCAARTAYRWDRNGSAATTASLAGGPGA